METLLVIGLGSMGKRRARLSEARPAAGRPVRGGPFPRAPRRG